MVFGKLLKRTWKLIDFALIASDYVWLYCFDYLKPLTVNQTQPCTLGNAISFSVIVCEWVS